MALKLLRLPEVKARTGLCRTGIYNKIAAGEFPAQIKLGSGPNTRSSAWLESEIDQWIASLASKRQGAQP